MSESIKISQLNTLSKELADTAFVPVVQNGQTWKFAPRTKFVKNTGDETIAGVKTFSSSPLVPAGDATGEAVNYDQLTALDRKHSVVDNSSRVSEYTGDGIPLIPDNAAGTTYRSNFATTDLWSATNGTITATGGRLVFNKTSTSATNMYADRTMSFSAKQIIFKLTALQAVANFDFRDSTGAQIFAVGAISAGETKYVVGYLSGSTTFARLLCTVSSATITGNLVSLEFVYIGTGAYDTTAKDRAGNGNNLVLTAVTPVNGKYGKEMFFNGVTSLAYASSPVIGTTGTVAIRLKPASPTIEMIAFGNRRVGASGGIVGYIPRNTGSFVFQLVKADGEPQMFNAGNVSTSSFLTFAITWDGTTVKTYREGVLIESTVQAEPYTSPLDILTIGRLVSYQYDFFNGIISHFRYDSRIWTADEVLAWSSNPISVDSRV